MKAYHYERNLESWGVVPTSLLLSTLIKSGLTSNLGSLTSSLPHPHPRHFSVFPMRQLYGSHYYFIDLPQKNWFTDHSFSSYILISSLFCDFSLSLRTQRIRTKKKKIKTQQLLAGCGGPILLEEI